MEVVILGSGSPLPDPRRAGPATLIRTAAGDLLFDCGRGVLMRAAAAGTGAGALRSLFLTHLHSDHITDLNDLVTTRWTTTFEPAPLAVVGPVGSAALVAATEAMLEWDISYRLAHHADLTWRPAAEVTEAEVAEGAEVGEGPVFESQGVAVRAARTDHAPVRPTLAYRVDDGGRSVVVAGDTRPCPGLDALCAGADVLVHTAVRRDLIEQLGVGRLSEVLDYHSSVQDVARTGARAGVGTVVLTHLVPAPAPGAEGEWAAQASEFFGGRVVVAEDLTRLQLPA